MGSDIELYPFLKIFLLTFSCQRRYGSCESATELVERFFSNSKRRFIVIVRHISTAYQQTAKHSFLLNCICACNKCLSLHETIRNDLRSIYVMLRICAK